MSWPEDAPQVIERCQGLYGELQLQKKGEEYEIIYNGVFLMATYNGASEKASVREALALVTSKGHDRVRVLMGGLGVGYSLQEVLARREVARATVVEIEPMIIQWNRSFFMDFNGRAIEDPRALFINSDFREVLEEEALAASKSPAYKRHVIMVDTDNGSSWLSLPSNSFFYSSSGLSLISTCLHEDGAACFWASRREEVFEEELNRVFGQVSFCSVLERTGQEGCYYLAQKGKD